MEIYLVGGAVRDILLERPIAEKDWVVVGATAGEMMSKKFRPVGKDFPVFISPTPPHEEYALARTERKTGPGYKGFVFNADPKVTLEEDLMRRDLTINAMAIPLEIANQLGADLKKNASLARKHLIDPYGGELDLQNKLLHHVSKAFAEDPVRILRVGRFASRFGDFTVHPDTQKLMLKMVKAGEVDALVAERVWKELERGLGEDAPWRFFEVLESCGALEKLFGNQTTRESYETWESYEDKESSDEIDKIQFLRILKTVSLKNSDEKIRFAVQFHNWNSDDIKKLCQRYRISSNYCELAVLTHEYKDDFFALSNIDQLPNPAGHILKLFNATDAFRRLERFLKFLTACEIISQIDQPNKISDKSREPLRAANDIHTKGKISEMLIDALQAANDIDTKNISAKYNGKEIGEKISEIRENKIQQYLKSLRGIQ